jgi:IS30 family transposase
METIKTPGLLQPLSIPSQHWEEVSIDFITGLPKSEGKSVIMVIVDRLTKYTHFCALSHPFKASTVATAFMETVQKLHGSPKIIVSDRDPIFTGHFWTKLFSCLGTQLAHSSSYHPQSNGQTKIVNKHVWKATFVASSLINKHNGSNGYPWKNGGITLPFILQQK